MHATFYTHQTGDECAGMCMFSRTHQMGKTAIGSMAFVFHIENNCHSRIVS